MSFFHELRRRNVFRVGVAYALGAWVLLQIVDFVLEVIAAPDWILQVFFLAAAVGLPVVLIFSWVFEMTPQGIRRESEIDRSQSITHTTGRKLDRVIIATLVIAVAFLLADKFLLGPGPAAQPAAPDMAQAQSATAGSTPGSTLDPAATASPASAGVADLSIAVLPFIALSSGTDDEYFADGLTEEILNALAQLPELLVTARTSAFHFKGQDVPIQDIAETLGVRHIVEGSVRRSGERLRVTAQLIRTADGFHLWSENYDSTSQDTITVQEDIAEKIAVAMDVVMDEQKRQTMRQVGLRDVEAFIAYQKGIEWYDKAHGEMDQMVGLRTANQYLESVLDRVPGYPPALQLHSDIYIHMLVNDATGQELTGVTDEDKAGALENATADYTAAIEHARSGEERNNFEIDLAFITGDWHGMPVRFERFIAARGCDEASWSEPFAVIFGYAPGILDRMQEFRLCNPLSSTAWMREARIKLWAGDPAGAIEIAYRGSEIAPGAWLTQILITALVANGQFEQAEKEIDARFSTSEEVLIARMRVAAARGDRQSLEQVYEKYMADPKATGFFRLLGQTLMGNRAEANRLAGEVDQHSYGYVALPLLIYRCACGAPWDLSATPNFAALIEEYKAPWPPVSPINYPLKDW
jgi:TolB-like protein